MLMMNTKGPHCVTLPDGRIMSRADLPPPDTTRWVASRKAAVVRAVTAGLITARDACDIYALSAEELESWALTVARHGEGGLKTTRIQRYRQPMGYDDDAAPVAPGA